MLEDGSLHEYASCDASLNWTSCVLGEWGDWDIKCETKSQMPKRIRKIPGNYPEQCRGVTDAEDKDDTGGELVQLESCWDVVQPKEDCIKGDWSPWLECPKKSDC